MLEDNVGLPSNGKLYTKVINWVQRSIWENGGSLEDLMEEVSLQENGILGLIIKKNPQKANMKDDPIFFLFDFFPSLFKLTLKNLNFAVGTPKLRNWGGVQVS